MEAIPSSFDVMMTSRFPDSLKAHVFKESKRMIHSRPPTVPWITGRARDVCEGGGRSSAPLLRYSFVTSLSMPMLPMLCDVPCRDPSSGDGGYPLTWKVRVGWRDGGVWLSIAAGTDG